MANDCRTIVGGPVTLNVSGGRRIVNAAGGAAAFGTTVPTDRNLNFETEGSVTISPRNYTIEGRSEGRGHTKRNRNSMIEGTITLANGLFDPIIGPQTADDNTDTANTSQTALDIRQLFELCDLTVVAILDCGDVWWMREALFEGEESIDLREGTASFKFTSPRAMEFLPRIIA